MSIINKMHKDFQQVQQENPILAKMPEKKNRKKMFMLALILVLIGSSLGFSYLIFQQRNVSLAMPSIAEKSIEPVVSGADKEATSQVKQAPKSVVVAPAIQQKSVVVNQEKALQTPGVKAAQEKKTAQAPAKVNRDTNVNTAQHTPVKTQQHNGQQVSSHLVREEKTIVPSVVKEKELLAEEKISDTTSQKIEQENIANKKVSTLEIKTVSLSNAELAQIHLKQAIEAEKKGDLDLAANERKQALTLVPTLNDERKSLALYYYSQGEIEKAKGLLQAGALVSPEYSDFNLMLSRMALKTNDYQMAYYYLEQHPPGVAGHLDYYVSHAILARKFHKNKQVEYLYQQLLTQQPNNGRWRMSLAIAQDKQSKVEMAINNYKQALLQADLSLKAKDYINQRLTYLEKSL